MPARRPEDIAKAAAVAVAADTDIFACLGSRLNGDRALDALLPAADEPPTRYSDGPAALIGRQAAHQNRLLTALTGSGYWLDADLATPEADVAAAAATPSEQLAAAYRRHGEQCFTQLGGAFSAVIIDAAAGRVLAAVDRLGQQPLYYAPRHGGLLLASRARQLLRHPELNAGLSAQGVHHYVYFHMLPSPASIYEGVHKIPAGHYLSFSLDDPQAALRCYWRPDFSREPGISSETYAEQLQQVLRRAVARPLARGPAGAFLSGGLDSSTVSGLLAEQQPQTPTFSIGFDAKGYDEIPFARISAKRFGTEQHEYYVTPDDIVAAIPLIASAYDEPFGNSSAIPTYYCARLAANSGVTRLLAGDGGDELFAGNARYAKQKIFELYYGLPGALRGVLDATLPRLPSLPLAGKLKSYSTQAQVPLPDRLESYNFLHRIDPYSVFSDDALAAIDQSRPLKLLRERYRQPDNASTLDRMLYLDWQFTLADNDLRKVTQMCALNGVEVAYPFLDDDVVAFSCRVPDRMKLKGTRLRHFYKQAMGSFLPPQVLNKSKHGFGLPFGVWMRSHAPLQQLAYDSLQALAKRSYFRPEFLDTAVKLHRTGHAGYYGELVWVLMVLELWLQAHKDR